MKFLDRRIQRERMDKGVTTSTAGELFGTNDFRNRGTLGSGTGKNCSPRPGIPKGQFAASVATIMKKLAGGSRLSES